MTLWNDLRFAVRSLARTKGLTVTVVLTLALGIGANAAIFTLVRGVLLRPLVNRDEDRLIYIRQSARGINLENAVFSVPEIQDLRARVKTLSAFGDFSTIGFTMVGLGEPREVRAGVVGGSYFEVMGLHPVLGRLLDMHDDGPNAAGAAVLTYRFWTTILKSDPSVIGKQIRLGERSATIVGVLEPSVPYPAETEIIANVVTSPHHLSATMVTGRVRREGELAIRAALGASSGALRRTLLAESLLLCGAGAILGVLSARPMVAILARYASRFSVRALDLTIDASMLWVGAGLAILASVLLAFVPRLPSASASQGFGLASGGVRITGSTSRRLRIFAVTQIAASFMLLAGASMLIKTLLTLQATQTGFDMRCLQRKKSFDEHAGPGQE